VIAFFFFFFWEFPNILSERLTHAMKKMNMDISTLALLANISPITVQRWLSETYQPRHVNLPKLICALQVPADYLCIE
jgi:transcriptional regulator with XRE-family HTH domain